MNGNRQDYQTDVAAALDAAEPSVRVEAIDAEVDAVVIASPVGATHAVVNLEKYRNVPWRPRGTVRAVSADGFIAAVGVRGGTGTLYADPDACKLVAVLNDDGWRDDRVDLDLRATPEWTLWTTNQGLKAQSAFAVVIEEGAEEIVTPSSVTMLELAQTFHASTSAKFKQAGRLQDGRTQFTYEEEIDAKAGDGGALSIPAEFTLALRPFFGADRIEVKARLRYRLSRGELQIGYFLHRADDVRRAAFDDVTAKVSGALDLPLVAGSPASPVTAF